MADVEKEVKIKYVIDDTKAKKEITEINKGLSNSAKSIDQVEKETKDLNKAFNETGKAAAKNSQALKKTNKELKTNAKDAKAAKTATGGLGTSMAALRPCNVLRKGRSSWLKVPRS